jgi:hypothetical protein
MLIPLLFISAFNFLRTSNNLSPLSFTLGKSFELSLVAVVSLGPPPTNDELVLVLFYCFIVDLVILEVV